MGREEAFYCEGMQHPLQRRERPERQTDRQTGGGGGAENREGGRTVSGRQTFGVGGMGRGGGILWSFTLSPDTLTQEVPMVIETINKQTNTRKVSMAQTEGSGDVNNFSR